MNIRLNAQRREEAEGRISGGVSGLGLCCRAVNEPSRSFTTPGEGGLVSKNLRLRD